MDENLLPHSNYWLTYPTNDCFFIVGSVSGSIEPERIGALKIFLMAYSEPFRNMLEKSAMAEQGDVVLTDIEPNTFKNFLKCIYGGGKIIIPKLSFGECADLLYVLEKYLVTQFKAEIIELMTELLSRERETLFTAISNPVCFQVKQLEKVIAKKVAYEAERLFSDTLFLKLSSRAVLWILQLECLNISEIDVWEAVLKWAKHCTGTSVGEDLRKHLFKHLKYIRFCSMNCDKFCEKVVITDILTPEEVYTICKTLFTKETPNLEHICNNTLPRKNLPVLVSRIENTTFSHIVENVSALREKHSVEFYFQNYFWKILVWRRNNYLGIFLDCRPNSVYINTSNWECMADAQLILVNQRRKTRPNITRSFSYTFNKDRGDLGFRLFHPWENVMDPKNGFVKNNTIFVQVRIEILRAS